jgi:hypothetical protein
MIRAPDDRLINANGDPVPPWEVAGADEVVADVLATIDKNRPDSAQSRRAFLVGTE